MMACMHKETYKIYHNDQNLVPKGYVDIDEWIAPAIEVLNQKGYTTRFCCSGHPFADLLLLSQDGYTKGHCFGCESYISFREGITLPTLPNGFTVDEYCKTEAGHLVIRQRYPVTNEVDAHFFETAQQILDAMQELYEWALTLPEREK